jgi:hypothetical protein
MQVITVYADASCIVFKKGDGVRVNCDWLAFYFDSPGAPEYAGDFFIRVDVETGVQTIKRGFHVFEGSFDTTVAVRSLDGRVYFSGNPSRFGREDNLFGYSVRDAYRRAGAILGLVGITCPFAPTFTRIDLNTNLSFGTPLAASQYMRVASAAKTSRQRQRAYDGDTVTYGEGSRYFYSKIYLKGVEMQRHNRGALADWVFAQGVVRYEAEYKSGFLRGVRGLSVSAVESELMKDFFSRCESHLAETKTLRGVDDLPARVRTTYIAWLQGYEPRDLLSRPTWYRHRRELQEFGVDIAIPASSLVRGEIPVSVVIVKPVPLCAPDGYVIPPAHLIELKRKMG